MTVLTLHECRRTFASLMIAAGANAKALFLDAYLVRASETAARASLAPAAS